MLNYHLVFENFTKLLFICLGKPPGGLLLYGGFDKNMTALSDCWKMDFANGKTFVLMNISCVSLEIFSFLFFQSYFFSCRSPGTYYYKLIRQNFLKSYIASKLGPVGLITDFIWFGLVWFDLI